MLVSARRRPQAGQGSAVSASATARRRWLVAMFLGTQLLSALPAHAQSNVDGSIYGKGTKGASVVVTNRATGYRLSGKISAEGTFSFAGVPIGEYDVVETLPDGSSLTETVSVQVGRGTGVAFADAAVKLEGVTVTGKKLKLVDTSSSESGFSISGKQIAELPISRDLSSVTLLTPGAVSGATTFGAGTLPSFGGSTVAENVYYLNGFDISDLRTRLAPSTIPFEFYQDFQTKTGGYSAEFGRSTGGAVNTVSKRGTNTWQFGANAFFEPDLGNNHKQVSYVDSTGTRVWYDPKLNHSTGMEYNAFVGGPIIKDHLFVYGLAALTNNHDDIHTPGSESLGERKQNYPFYAGKIDWQIIDGQLLEATLLRDARTTSTTTYGYDGTVPSPTTGKAVGVDRSQGGNLLEDRGGTIQIYRYTGHFFDDLTVSGLYGYLNSNLTNPLDFGSCPFVNVIDSAYTFDQANYQSLPRAGVIGCNKTGDFITTARDSRKQYRFDLAYAPEWLTTKYTGKHSFKAGIDREENLSQNSVQSTGGYSYRYQAYKQGDPLPNGAAAPADDIYIRRQLYNNTGTDTEKLNGLYFEDTINFSNRLTAVVGFRKDSFKEINNNKVSFLDLTTPFAPRLGLTFDVLGDGSSKLFANYGRYYTPLATQITVRNGNPELFYSEYYRYAGTNSGAPNYTPNLGDQVGDRVTTSPGVTKDPRTLVNPSVRPTYQDEISVGYATDLPQLFENGGASAGLRFIYRKLGRTIEDSALDAGLNRYFAQNPDQAVLNSDGSFANGFDYYFVTNPGEAATIFLDTDASGKYCNETGNGNCTGTGNLKALSLPAELLGYGKPKRKYYATELTFERIVPGKWRYQASYTWSQSYGNYEGPVNSTIGQADIGITQDFDQPGFADGAYGPLYGDRRHNFKLFGSYNVTREFEASANFFLLSGRPLSVFGYHPTDPFAAAYGAFSFYDNTGALVQRGSAGRTPWVRQLDLSFHYTPAALKKNLVLGLDVLNVLDYGSYYSKVETQALGGPSVDDSGKTVPGAVDPTYGLPLQYQAPRSIRLSASYRFGL